MNSNPYESPKAPPQTTKVSWRYITKHLTDAERRRFMAPAGIYGMWSFATLGAPFAVLTWGILGHERFKDYWPIALALIALHIFCLPRYLNWQRKVLAETEFARAQGIDFEAINMSPFAKGSN